MRLTKQRERHCKVFDELRRRLVADAGARELTGSEPLFGVAHGAIAARFESSARVRVEVESRSMRSWETVLERSLEMRMEVG